ncbi:MAG: enoyl-CoA hydratase-related protein [Pseudomonadota bacterium]
MQYETILYHVTDDIARITLNRPEVMNGLNAQMRIEILHALKRAPEEARAIVLTGSGRAFCSGQDLGDRVNAASIDLERTLREEYEPMLKAIYDCPIPTIAAVNGAAAGAGANLALAADVVIATESAVFIQAFARIGLIPDAGGTYWLPRQMGFAKAMGAALFAEKIPARKAEQWGMIWEAVPDDAFAQTVEARAAQLAKGPTKSYGLIKQALRQSFDNTLDDQLAIEAELQGHAGKTRDFT